MAWLVVGLLLLVIAGGRLSDAAPTPLPPAKEAGSAASGDALEVRITPEMVRYSYTRYALYFVGTAWRAAALVLLLACGLSARIRDAAARRVRAGPLQTIAWFLLAYGAYSVLMLPLRVYAGYFLPHEYALSTQTPAGFLADLLKSTALTALIGAPVAALVVALARRSPRRWWWGMWLALIPLTVAGAYVQPLVIDPMFNRFQPLRDERLREHILELADRAGIRSSRVLEMDASRRTRGVNAYVTGIGGSARIVLWDTLLEKLEEEEVLAVMGHEIGHYVERHVHIGIGLSLAGSLLVLALAASLTDRLLRTQGRRWRLQPAEGLRDPAALPALALVLLGLNFAGAPLEAAVSRTMESRADAFALRLTEDGKAAARSFVKLADLNLSHPSPPAWIEWWMFSHPPLSRRIRAALEWEPTPGPRRAAPPAGQSPPRG